MSAHPDGVRCTPPRVDVEHFEAAYAEHADPWRYMTSGYEREKYSHTLAALPPAPLGRVLEVGCSIGVFTRMLAPRCRRLVALDFSEQALALARARLAPLGNVELLRARFPEAAPAGEWDAIVCAEVLYYLDRPALRTAADWLGRRLGHGASVLAVSWRGAGRREPLRGDEVHDLLAEELHRWHVSDERREGYRLDRFDGDGR